MGEEEPLNAAKTALTEDELIADFMQVFSEKEINEKELKEGVAFLKPYIGSIITDLKEEDFLSVKTIKDNIKKALEKVSQERPLTEGQKEDMEAQLEDVFIYGKTLSQALGMNKDLLEWIYGEASRLYYHGKYEEAYGTYRILDMMIPNSPKLMFGIAACLQMMKQLKEATGWYLRTAFLDKTNPLPYYHAIDCLLKMKDYPGAYGAMYALLQRTKDIPKYQAIERKVKLMWEGNKDNLEAWMEIAKKEGEASKNKD